MLKQFLILAVLASLVLPCVAEPDLAAPRTLCDYDLPGLKKKIRLDSRGRSMPINDVLQFAALKGNLSMVISEAVTGNVKLLLDEVEICELIELALASVSVTPLAYEMRGNILRVMTAQEYLVMHGVGFHDPREMKIIELKYAEPSHIVSLLKAVVGPQGTVVPDVKTGTLILIDSADKIKEMEAVIATAEIPSVTRERHTVTQTYTLQYGDVNEILPHVQSMLTETIGRARADIRTKTLIVEDTTNRVRRISRMILLLDRRPKEVFIEAKILTVQLTDDFKFGINWEHLIEGIDPRFEVSSANISPLLARGSGNFSLSYGIIGDGNQLSMVLDAIKTVGDTKILSNPHVAVLDGHEAVIKVVRDEPLVEAQLESGSTNVIAEKISFIEVGVTLSVIPQINDEGFITVDIRPEVSTVVDIFPGRFPIPVVQKALAETRVMVRDGQTVIIGGLIQDQKADITSRVPILGKLPLIGALFRSTSVESISSELVVFLTPRIMTGNESIRRMRDMKKRPKNMRSGGEAGKQAKAVRGRERR